MMNIPDKFKSRKFWLAMVGEIVGIVALIWGAQDAEMVSVIAGAVITILSTLGYLKVEGDIDKAGATAKVAAHDVEQLGSLMNILGSLMEKENQTTQNKTSSEDIKEK